MENMVKNQEIRNETLGLKMRRRHGEESPGLR